MFLAANPSTLCAEDKHQPRYLHRTLGHTAARGEGLQEFGEKTDDRLDRLVGRTENDLIKVKV